MSLSLEEIIPLNLIYQIKKIYYKDIEYDNKIFELLILLKKSGKELKCIPSNDKRTRYTCIYNGVILKVALCQQGINDNIREIELYPYIKEFALKPYDISIDGILAIYEKI